MTSSLPEQPGLPSPSLVKGKFGWGGRIRTFTIHINSVVSYRLDHAPAVWRRPTAVERKEVGSAASVATEGFSKIARPGSTSTTQLDTKNSSFFLHCASIDKATRLLPGTREVDL